MFCNSFQKVVDMLYLSIYPLSFQLGKRIWRIGKCTEYGLPLYVVPVVMRVFHTHSPCIDAGDPAGDYTDQTDIDGQQRVLYDRVDMGVDEVFPIAGDIDMDGDVDFDDFAYFSMHWLKGK